MNKLKFFIPLLFLYACGSNEDRQSQLNQSENVMSSLSGYAKIWNGNTPEDIKTKLPAIFARGITSVTPVTFCMKTYNSYVREHPHVTPFKQKSTLIICIKDKMKFLIDQAIESPPTDTANEDKDYGKLWSYNKPFDLMNPYLIKIALLENGSEFTGGPYLAMKECYDQHLHDGTIEQCLAPHTDQLVDDILADPKTPDPKYVSAR